MLPLSSYSPRWRSCQGGSLFALAPACAPLGRVVVVAGGPERRLPVLASLPSRLKVKSPDSCNLA
jgi:hypothetical protein